MTKSIAPAKTRTSTCQQCEETFEVQTRGGPVPTYCSEDCRNLTRRARTAPRGQTWCKVSFAECDQCGELFSRRTTRQKTCPRIECKRAREARWMTEWMRRYRAETGQRYAAQYPEDVERKAARSRRRNAQIPVRQRYPAQFAAKDARRRMKIAEATVEQFDPAEIFDRDGWICQLCAEPVDPRTAFPDPGSKSLDHRVPIAHGGEHSRANTQLAHLSCNIAKRDRLDTN